MIGPILLNTLLSFVYFSNRKIYYSLILIAFHEVVDKICVEKCLNHTCNKWCVLDCLPVIYPKLLSKVPMKQVKYSIES